MLDDPGVRFGVRSPRYASQRGAVIPADFDFQVLISHEFESVGEVQRSLDVSRRHFAAEVRRRCGLTPKALQRIARMRRMLEELDARKPIHWSCEAVSAGYTDQPHAIRDFRAFTGMTPVEYVRRRQRAWGNEVEAGEAASFVPELIR